MLLDERPTPAPECRPREETAVRLRVTLHTTAGCNLTCRHCFQSPASEGVLQGRPVPFPVLQARLDQCQAAGAVSVVLTGGEILTHPQWRSIVSAATARFEVTVVTNGTLVSEEAADFLADAGVHVQVSLAGPDAETHDALRGPGAYARTMAGIQRLLDRGVGPRMTWSTCVNRHNLAHISTLAQQAFTLGVGRLYLIWLAPRGCAVGNWEQLSTFAEERVALVRALRPLLRAHHERIVVAGCGDPRETTCPLEAGECALIDVDGSVYPCILLADARYRLGNTEAEGLAAARLAGGPATAGAGARPVERIAECRACSGAATVARPAPAWPGCTRQTGGSTMTLRRPPGVRADVVRLGRGAPAGVAGGESPDAVPPLVCDFSIPRRWLSATATGCGRRSRIFTGRRWCRYRPRHLRLQVSAAAACAISCGRPPTGAPGAGETLAEELIFTEIVTRVSTHCAAARGGGRARMAAC